VSRRNLKGYDVFTEDFRHAFVQDPNPPMHHARDFGSHLSGEEIKDCAGVRSTSWSQTFSAPPAPPKNWSCVLGGRVGLECWSALLEKNMLGQKT